MHGDVMDAVPDLSRGIGHEFGIQTVIDGPPGLPSVVGAESARRRDGDVNSLGIARVEDDGVKAHAACAGLPARAGAVFAQAGEFLPVLAAVGGVEYCSVFDARIDLVRVGKRRLKMPDAFEFPGVRCTVVPLMRAGNGGVSEFVADGFPGLSAVIGALDHLSVPASGL